MVPALIVVVMLVAALLPGSVVLAQDAGGCAPVSVGDETGVYFLVLSDRCTVDKADGYAIVADLSRDDQPEELLVLVQGNADDDTRLVAEVLAAEVRVGGVDGNKWHTETNGASQQRSTAGVTGGPPTGDDQSAPPAPEDAGSGG